jgi:hypothetical protein
LNGKIFSKIPGGFLFFGFGPWNPLARPGYGRPKSQPNQAQHVYNTGTNTEAEARGQQCKLRYIPGSDVVVAIYSQGDNDGTTTKSRRGKVDHMEPDPSLGPPPELIWEAEHAPGVLRYNSDEDQYYIDRSPNPNPDPIVKSPDDL